MKSSTGNSLSVLVVTFLKYSPAFLPAIGAFIRGCSWAAVRTAVAKPTTQTPTTRLAVRLIFHETFMFIYPP